jgi:amino-acid N-acetyltransferase
MKSSSLLREVVREYVRSQRRAVECGDTASTVDCHILTELHRNDGITQQELANRLLLDKGWISRGIDRLVNAGLVERTPDQSDRRRTQLSLLSAGVSRAAALETRLDGHAASLLAQLSQDQDNQLAAALGQILANLKQQRCGPSTVCQAPKLQFRRAQAADWPAIRQLLQDASLPTEDASAHLDRFTAGVDATGLVAVGGLERHGADALLRSFVLAPRLRRSGQGSNLLRHVLRDAEAAGVEHVYLLTSSAAPFFARHGFRLVERKDAPPSIRNTPEFKHLCPASASLMTLSLPYPDDTPC